MQRRKLVIASHSRLFYREPQSPCVSDQTLLIQSPSSAEGGLTYVNCRALMWRENPTTTAGHACMHCLAARRNPLSTYITVFPPNSSRPLPLLFSPPHVCPSCRTERPTSSPSTPSAPLRYVFPLPLLPRHVNSYPAIAIFFYNTSRRWRWVVAIADEVLCRSMPPSRPTQATRAPLWAWPRWLTLSGTSS
jgi:hypothetical protein